jgi:hypothetical protein
VHNPSRIRARKRAAESRLDAFQIPSILYAVYVWYQTQPQNYPGPSDTFTSVITTDSRDSRKDRVCVTASVTLQ